MQLRLLRSELAACCRDVVETSGLGVRKSSRLAALRAYCSPVAKSKYKCVERNSQCLCQPAEQRDQTLHSSAERTRKCKGDQSKQVETQTNLAQTEARQANRLAAISIKTSESYANPSADTNANRSANANNNLELNVSCFVLRGNLWPRPKAATRDSQVSPKPSQLESSAQIDQLEFIFERRTQDAESEPTNKTQVDTT